MKKTRVLAVLTMAAMVLSACGANGDLKKTAVEVNDTKVSAGDVAVMAVTQMAYSGAGFEETMESVAEQIEVSFQYGELGKAMGIKLTDEEKNQATSTRAQYASTAGGYAAYSKYLKENGSDIEFLDELFTASMYMNQVQAKITEELAETEATDDELKEYYGKNYYRAKHILINKPEETADDAKTDALEGEDLAKDLLEKAKAGEDFDAMMKEYTQDPGSESKPDGYVFTDGEMVTEFEEAVKALKPGEVGFCESSYGYHIILRLDLPEFEENKDAVSQTYETKRLEKRFEELLKEHKIESVINEDVIKAVKEDMLTEAPQAQTTTY